MAKKDCPPFERCARTIHGTTNGNGQTREKVAGLLGSPLKSYAVNVYLP